jgi:methyl-accepting chemotaxis protein
MTVSKKMILGFAGLVLITAILGGVGYIGLSQALNSLAKLVESDVEYVNIVDRISIEILQNRRYEKDFFLNIGNPDKQNSYIEKFGKKTEEVRSDIRKLQDVASSNEQLGNEVKENISELSGLYDRYCQCFQDVRMRVESDPEISTVEANKLMAACKKPIHDLESLVDVAAQEGSKLLRDSGEAAIASGATAKTWIGVIGLVCIGIAATLGFLIPRSVVGAISGVASGLSDSADQVTSASFQLASSSQSLAEGSSEQAASLEEISSAMEEMATMTRQNADNSGQASSLSNDTKATTESCSNSMQEMAAAIGQVNESSQETQKIVKTIDEIAFQTNLLALNAAVEAARAGEAGAGFAVVAEEVRNLAMRAADAAKNTNTQIDDIMSKINEAMEMVFKSIDEFAKVDENTRRVNDLVVEIAAASGEQAQGIDQVTKSLSEMDKVVQRNAANAEESASASEEMSAQAESMKSMVSHLASLVGRTRKGAAGRLTMRQVAPPEEGKGKAASRQMVKTEAGTSTVSSREVGPDQLIPMDDGDF